MLARERTRSFNVAAGTYDASAGGLVDDAATGEDFALTIAGERQERTLNGISLHSAQ